MVDKPFVQITNLEVWQALRDLENLKPDSSPAVRKIDETAEDLAGMKWKFYITVGALSTGLVLSTILRLTGITPTGALRALGIG